MSKLGELKRTLENHIYGEQLVLNTNIITFGDVSIFLETLPEKQLTINITADDISFSDSTFPQTLALQGQLPGWAIKGLDDPVSGETSLRDLGLSFTFTQQDENALIESVLELEGIFRIQEVDIPISGRLIDGKSLHFNLCDSSTITLSLSTIANFFTHSAMIDCLPIGVDIFDSLELKELELIFGFSKDSVTCFNARADIENCEWQFVEKLPSIKNIGVTIHTQYTPCHGNQLTLTYGGDIHGTVHIQQDYDIIIYFQGRNFWELGIIPANGVLPGLSELATLVGGESLEGSVQDGLDALGLEELSIDGVKIGFDLSQEKLRYLSMRGHITVAGVRLDVYTKLPDFQFGGTLAKESRIHLKALVEYFFTQAEEFPEIDITDLAFTAYPGAGNYTIHGGIEDDWAFDIGEDKTIALSSVELALEKSTEGVSGSFSASFNIAGTNVFITANNPAPGEGWRFEGSTGAGQEIPIGDLVEDIAEKFGGVTLPTAIKELVIENLDVSFNTKTKDFFFTCESKFPIDGQEVDIVVTIDVKHNAGAFTKTFGGRITIGTLEFDLHFLQNATSNFFIATYSHTADTPGFNIKELVEHVSADAAAYIPASLEIDLKDVIFAYSKGTQGSKFLFGLDIGTGLNLSNLPLVGQEFPPDQTLGVDDLQVLVVSQPFTVTQVQNLNALIPEGITKLPDVSQNTDPGQPNTNQNQPPAETTALERGLNVSAKLNLGGTEQTLTLPASSSPGQGSTGGQPSPPLAAPPSQPGVTASDNAKWFNIQKSFGPVHFERVGFQYQDQVVWFLLDAALSAAGLTLSLDGLGFGSSIDHFDPQFDLHGLGVDCQNGPVEIGGAFLRTTVEKDGEKYDEYDGAAIIKANVLTLSAIGSYAYLDGHPSLFIYAVLDYPLGGPSFFFVTGLVAGFGCNRSLLMPSIDQVAQFPLVEEAVSGPPQVSPGSSPSSTKTLTAELNKLQCYIPPAVGEYFLAVGIKFTSFKLIDSFALLTVACGHHFEIHVLGLSTMILPTPEAGKAITPLAEVQMALKASFMPDEGFLGVIAQLTPASYILSRDCHLTGGLAFYCWFSGAHAGEFVFTLGGYHPNFKVPAHYPRVPRLGFNWQVDSHLSLKGEAYCALVPSAMMAGGHLEATWHSGDLKAWFNAGADFLIAWKPFHYDAHVYVDMGVSYTYHVFGTHHLTIDVGADLHIWGPDFSGTAHVHLWIITFDVTFGAAASQEPLPIAWNTFRESFLPDEGAICGVSVKDGLMRTVDRDQSAPEVINLGVINPKHFALVTDSVIPSTQASLPENQVLPTDGANGQLGIGPMGVEQMTATHTITITRDGDHVETDFKYKPILKNVPAGLWGQSLKPSLNGNTLIDNALSGFEIRPANPPTPGETQPIERSKLQYATESFGNAYDWEELGPFTPKVLDESQRRDAIGESIVNGSAQAREQLLTALGMKPEHIAQIIDLSDSIADDFLIAPQIEAQAS